MGASLLYDMDEKHKNMNRNFIVDYNRGEVIDVETGEVVEDHLMEGVPHIRASDYAEWESKRHHEVFVSERDRRLWDPIFSVGERIKAPKWLQDEVLWFYKVSRRARDRLELGGRGLSLKEKCVLAVYYVVAVKRGLVELAERIASMPCDESGTPCYKNRKVKDREFGKCVSLVLKLWGIVVGGTSYRDTVRNYIRCFCLSISEEIDEIDVLSVASRALEILNSINRELYGDVVARKVLKLLKVEHGVSELSIRSILKRLSEGEKGG